MHYPPGAEKQARALLQGFAPRRNAAAAWLGLKPAGRPEIYLVKNHAGMVRRIGPNVPDWAVAVVRDDDVLVFRLDRIGRNPADSLALVLKHEVVHQVLNHMGPHKLPRWFEEGLCVYFAGVPFLDADYSVERLAAGGGLPSLQETERGFFGGRATAARSYKVSHSAVTYFLERFAVPNLQRLVRLVGGGKSFESSFVDVTGDTLDEFEARWRKEVTPRLPFLLFVLLENFHLTLLVIGALIVVVGYIRWRLRRERAMRSLDE